MWIRLISMCITLVIISLCIRLISMCTGWMLNICIRLVIMCMDWILNELNTLRNKRCTMVGSLLRTATEDVLSPPLTKLDEYVYEVYKPAEEARRPTVEIVFFHGVQLEHFNAEKAHIMTWITRDKRVFWLNWLHEYFPNARILTILYDASLKKTNASGRMDMHLTGENLVHSFTSSNVQVGQDGCPVVLVGYCLGGLVMKELCIRANSILNLNRRDRKQECVENLLLNVRGLFSYASPHHGTRLADGNIGFQKGLLFENLEIDSTNRARQGADFQQLRKDKGWKANGVGESLPVILGSFTGLVVPEASARHDVDNFYTVAADHFNVCKPIERNCNIFQLLCNFIADVVKEDNSTMRATLLGEFEGVGLDDSVKIIREKLDQGARRLGIVGMGGIGKITLAKAIFDKISGNFDYACFLGDIKSIVPKITNEKTLRDEVVRKLTKKGRSMQNSSFDWRTLRGNKVLIVLDDVDSEPQVTLMTTSDGFSEDSRLIVTSRDVGFLRRQEFGIHIVRGLDLDDSKRLLCLHAFEDTRAPRGYEDRVRKIAEKCGGGKECGGFPLALKLLGRYLYKLGKDMWDDAFEQLRLVQPFNGKREDGLWSVLRVSFNSLADSEQKMFLDAATYFSHEQLEDVQKMWRVCSWAKTSASSGWQNLVDMFFVNKRDDGYISMHEVLRDLGQDIARGSRATHSHVHDVLVVNRLSKEERATVKVLMLNHQLSDDLDANALSEFKELEILSLRYTGLRGYLPDVLPKVVFFAWTHTTYFLREKRKGELQKSWGEIKRNWRTPQNLWEQPPDVLSKVAFEFTPSESLFGVREGELQKSLGQIIGQLQSLIHLQICCDFLTELPESICQLTALQHLEINYCDSLRALPSSLGHLHSTLKYLKITRCENFTELPKSVGNLKALTHLIIESCPSLRALPSTLGQLQVLQELVICSVTELTELPDSIGQLMTLQQLKIGSCSLKTLPSTIGRLKDLEDLIIQNCHQLTELPDSIGQLMALEKLEIWWCSKLTELPDSIGQLMALRTLDIRLCQSLKTIPSTLQQLKALELLTISECFHLTELPVWAGKLRAKVYFKPESVSL